MMENSPFLITRQADLVDACMRLANYDVIAIDTEFMRENTFWPQLCLIQIATSDLVMIIDPLADNITLEPFFKLMSNNQVLKVFHSARQDIEIIWHYGKVIPNPIFDSQIAAMVLGYGDAISYNRLVKKIAGVSLDKNSRISNWRKRPLTSAQLEYSASDVRYLGQIHKNLSGQLVDRQRTEWVSEEIALLIDPATYDFSNDNAWKRLKTTGINTVKSFAVLKGLAAWREQKAKGLNVPRRRVISDEAILCLAKLLPTTPEMLRSIRTLSRKLTHSRLTKEIVAVIKGCLTPNNHNEFPPAPKPNLNADSAIADLLKLLLKGICEQNKVAPKVIANSNDIVKIATQKNSAKVPALTGWRYQLFGQFALAALNGEIAVYIENNTIKTKTL